MTKSKNNFKIWMVRAGRGSYLIEEFLKENIVAIGWNAIGPLEEGTTLKTIKEKLSEAYPDDSDNRIRMSAGQLFRMFKEFKVGDKVVTYDSDSRVYYLGNIVSGYQYSEKQTYRHYRTVEWIEEPISRDELSVSSKNTLGAILTIFEIPLTIWEELIEAHPSFISEEEQADLNDIIGKLEHERIILEKEYNIITNNIEDQLEDIKEDVISRSNEFIKDLIVKLEWHELEKLVAGILQAMGYKARLTGRGPDLGSDIIASPDGLEMTEPIIKVEVKHKIKSKEKIGAPDIRSFVGGLRNTTKGIYVSSTGFSKDAKMEAERANFQITLVDLDRLVELLIEYYETLDSESRALVPLKRIYWPV